MTKPTKKAFRDVFDKFIHIGNCYYNAKHYDNVLNIFHELEKEDQRVLLLGVYYLYAVMEHGVIPGTDEPDVKPRPERLEENPAADVAVAITPHDKAMTELKVWFVKMLVSTVCLGFVALTAAVLFLGNSTDQTDGAISRTFKIFSLLFLS